MPIAIMTMTPNNRGDELLSVAQAFRGDPNYRKFTFVFVEGSDDKEFWNHYRAESCEVIEAIGRDKVIDALNRKHRVRELRRCVAGIVDADYELIDASGQLNVEDLLYDDQMPDLENLIVFPKTVRKTIRRSRVFNCQNEADKFAGDWLKAGLKLSMDYGYFRIVARKHRNFGLVPNSIEGSYRECVDYNSLRLQHYRTAELLIDRSPNIRISVADLLEFVCATERRFERSRLLVRGKDLLNFMLCICLPVFENTNGDESIRAKLSDWLHVVRGSDDLFERLQGNYQCEDLKRTKIYGRIRDWERASKRYRILNPDI